MQQSALTKALDYDYLIVGGGAAGLSLAYHIAREPGLADKKVLLIEPEAKDPERPDLVFLGRCTDSFRRHRGARVAADCLPQPRL